MAANIVTPVVTDEGRTIIVHYSNMIADSTGDPAPVPADAVLESVQCDGAVYDTSGAVSIDATNYDDATEYEIMGDDVDNSAMTFTADGIKGPARQARGWRPRTTANGAGGLVDVDIIMFFKRSA